jgi:hypothetical protein
LYEQILSNNIFDDMDIKKVYFDPITVSIKYGKLNPSLPN